jgi:Ser/Thr protein kinase RdoA (MazF antagonist)
LNRSAEPTEERLAGGYVNEVVRVGSTVRRTAGAWTPAVHALLRHLEESGFAEAPKVLGIDEQGREILTFMEGDTIGWTNWPPVMLGTNGIVQLGSVLRRYHDIVRSFQPPPDAVWRNPLAPKSGELILHGDFSPFNTVWRSDRVVGVIDWDFAMPGVALTDLAYLAWYSVPLDQRAVERGFRKGVDHAARLRVLCAAYGKYDPDEVVDAAIKAIETERAQTAQLAVLGLAPWTRFAADGNLEAFDETAAWIRANRGLLLG